MSTQPEALELADMLDLVHPLALPFAGKAAAELRRLHEVNADLLDALCMVLDDPDALDGRPLTYECVRAAIAKATGEKHDS